MSVIIRGHVMQRLRKITHPLKVMVNIYFKAPCIVIADSFYFRVSWTRHLHAFFHVFQ